MKNYIPSFIVYDLTTLSIGVSSDSQSIHNLTLVYISGRVNNVENSFIRKVELVVR